MRKILVFTLCILAFNVYSQNERSITTAVPFLNIAADARAAGMGDMGVATSTDVFSQQWNAAKYAFATKKIGIGISYTPYLESVVTNIALLNANFYNKINERSAFAFSVRYFTLGEIELRQFANDIGTTVKPNELSLDGSYSLKLSDQFSMAVTGRFISSNLRFPDTNGDATAANTFAVDISGFYRSREIAYNSFDGRWRAGFNISNLGSKLAYDASAVGNFLPTNLSIGGGFDFILDQDNVLAITVEFDKLLVPTPRDFNGDGNIDAFDNDEYNNIGFFSGVFESFGDAPDGFSEELKEFTWALGAEYTYQDAFMLRTGYFNESEEKGSRKFFSLGAGFKFKAAQVDLSYLFSSSKISNPLENTLRFSLTFGLGEEYYED